MNYRYLILIIPIFLSLACKAGAPPPEPEKNHAPPVAAEKNSPRKQTPQTSSSTPSKAAAGTCVNQSTVSVESKNGGYPKENSPNWEKIETAFAERRLAGLGSNGTAIVVYLANNVVAPEQLTNHKYKRPAGQGIVRLSFTDGTGNHPGIGEYTPNQNFKAPKRVGGKVLVEGGVGVQFAQGGTQGSATITSLTEDKVCGTFELKDRWTSAKGTFTAKLKK